MKKIIVALSGGIDSAVSAFLLKKAGFNVEAIFMQNWDSFINNDFSIKNKEQCEYIEDYNSAKQVSEFLNIKLHKIEFIKDYWDKVFLKMIDDYSKAKIPNPDILCNKFIKFDIFKEYVFNNFKCDFIATGHYAKKKIINNKFSLFIPKDKKKDQTYFLCELNQSKLAKVIFPLANLTKQEVKQIAKKYNFPNANKKDSTGICFIGERNFFSFLKNYLPIKKGNIIDIDNNEIIGIHDGIHFYTIGQRKGINISGMKEPYFVCEKDIQNNILYVVNKKNKEIFLCPNGCEVTNFNWISNVYKNGNFKLRYRHTGNISDVYIENEGKSTKIYFIEKVSSINIGQYAVLYDGDECLGGGEITKIF